MRILDRSLCAFFILAAVGLGGCKEEGPAEKAGKKVDEAVDKAGQVVNDGKEKVEATAEQAVGAAKAGAAKVKKTAQGAVEKAKGAKAKGATK